MKHIDVNLSAYIDLGVKNNDKILILKLVIMWEYQNIKHFCKGYTPNWSEWVLVIKRIKNTCL